jgi:hypothetical protein
MCLNTLPMLCRYGKGLGCESSFLYWITYAQKMGARFVIMILFQGGIVDHNARAQAFLVRVD